MTSGGSQKKSENVNDKPWTVHDARVNLAALLNDPRKSRRDYDLFTKTWGETFRDLPPGSTIRRSKWVPNVVKGNFQDYLDNTSDRLLRHDSQTLKSSKATSNEENSYSQTGKNKVVMKSVIAAQHERDAILKTRAAVDALPQIFLQSDFAMENPLTFTTVLSSNKASTDLTSASSDTVAIRRGVSSSKLLQEKLSHYLDMVEMAIVRQISLRSDAFFKAMSSHEKLHEYLNATQVNVKHLLTKIKQVDQNIVHNSLQVVNLHQSKENLTSLMERLQMMVTVHQTQPTIQLLLSTNEYAGSLDLIRTTQEVLHQELAGLQCFRHLSSQLTEMERVIGHMMHKEMEECMCREIHRPIDEGHVCLEPHRITAITLGLLRQGQYDFLDGMRTEIEAAVKTLIKQSVLQAVEALPVRNDQPEDAPVDTRDERQETLASKMRMLIFSDWIVLLNLIFDRLLVLLRRVKSILNHIGAVANDSASYGGIIQRKLKHHKLPKARTKKTPKRREIATASDESAASDKLNPFLNEPSAVSQEDLLNPFLTDTPESDTPNPRQSSVKSIDTPALIDATNPFAEDVENDAMYGLASYEDELISSAADSYSAPPQPTTEDCNGYMSDDKTSSGQEDASDIKTESDTTSSFIGEAMNQEDLDNFARMLRDLSCWTCDFQHDRCVKVLIAKGKDSSLDKLGSSEFLLLAKSVKRFTTESESVVRRQSGGDSGRPLEDGNLNLNGSLRGALKTQAHRFVARFHEERRNKLSLILDNEVWKQAEVPPELSRLVQNLVDGHVTSQPNDLTNGHVTNEDQSKSSSECLEVDGENYAVVGTVLILLKMVTEYCKCSDDLPTSTPDLVHRLRDLLTLFNSRTCQLVLGAGALQLVGLKTITTKNLALASRCLQLVLHCIPSIRTHFEGKLMTHVNLQLRDTDDDITLPHKHRSVLRHFDHVTKDFQDHVNEIEHKLVSIVGGVFDRQLGRWEVKAPMPSPAFRQICKQINKFHETVSALLPQCQTRRIILKLNEDFRQRMRKLLHKFNVRNDGGPQHGLVTSDLNYYEANIKNLRAMEKVDLKLSAVWI